MPSLEGSSKSSSRPRHLDVRSFSSGFLGAVTASGRSNNTSDGFPHCSGRVVWCVPLLETWLKFDVVICLLR